MPARYQFTAEDDDGRLHQFVVVSGSYAEAEPLAKVRAGLAGVGLIGYGPKSKYENAPRMPLGPRRPLGPDGRCLPLPFPVSLGEGVAPSSLPWAARVYRRFVEMEDSALGDAAFAMAETIRNGTADDVETTALLRAVGARLSQR